MRKIYAYLIAIFILCIDSSTARAQYTITYASVDTTQIVDSTCHPLSMTLYTDVYSAGQSIETSWGDGTKNTSYPVNNAGQGFLSVPHSYYSPGTYTIKNVLIYNQQRIDSVVRNAGYYHCRTANIFFYFDANSNCEFDSLIDNYAYFPARVEIDSSHVAIDTVSVTGGLYYRFSGQTGTVYQFKAISLPDGLQLSCPLIDTIIDTALYQQHDNVPKSLGVLAVPTPNFDLAANVDVRAYSALANAYVFISNSNLNAQNATLTMHFSPKYQYSVAYPPPTSINGDTYTWNLTNISAMNPGNIYISFIPPTLVLPGDTILTSYYLSQLGGDVNLANNTVIKCDTVHAAWDPNHKSVSPQGDITAGTELEYTIEFENVGNASAQNIHIMDTLSDYVLTSTLKVVSASAYINTMLLNDGAGHKVLKFDFPGINLPDTSHHDSCRGHVIYSIQTKPNLIPGTYIPNRAGIYFDFNDVVMTNTAVNKIGIPQSVTTIGNTSSATLYPNPATDILTIKINANAFNNLEINNTIGQLLIKQKVTKADTKVNVKNLPAGIYTITLKGDGGTKTLKFEKL